jgi:hypothetical protein
MDCWWKSWLHGLEENLAYHKIKSGKEWRRLKQLQEDLRHFSPNYTISTKLQIITLSSEPI